MAIPPRANGTFKTGQRVPMRGIYIDQYGVVSFHEEHKTFPPAIGRKGECAFRRWYSKAAATA